MKRAVNVLLAIFTVIPVVLLFWPFASWNGAMSVILRVVPSLAFQALLCRSIKRKVIIALPSVFTGALAALGTYYYFTSPHWSNATFSGLFLDYISPFVCCITVLIGFFAVNKTKQKN